MWNNTANIFLVFILKCLSKCSDNHNITSDVNYKQILNIANIAKEKRQLVLNPLTTDNNVIQNVTKDITEVITEDEITSIVDETSEVNFNGSSSYGTTETSSEINPKEEELADICPLFQHSAELNFDKMVDVWQTVYYQMTENVPCFKIHIKRISPEEKIQYLKTYGHFNNSIDWKNCNLEVKAGDKLATNKKHFLQGGKADQGVLENIIILENDDVSGNKSYTLEEETPDQWLVMQKLLLMRDCETGDLLIFARVPYRPRREDIMFALKDVGEEMQGAMACDEESATKGKSSDEFEEE